jgi:hypothetical protein
VFGGPSVGYGLRSDRRLRDSSVWFGVWMSAVVRMEGQATISGEKRTI